jgi:hypothetical protein
VNDEPAGRCPDEDGADAEAEARRRRLRDRVFGDVLPETTEDERGPGPGPEGGGNDEWLRSNVPPHHG